MARLRKECEKAKRELSLVNIDKQPVNVADIGGVGFHLT